MRLIDADALNDAIYHEALETDSEMQKWDSGCWIRYKMFENAIDDAPTIEPKRGEWKRRIVDNGFNADWVCSECGYRVKTDFVDYNFCPNCGADMREREGE